MASGYVIRTANGDKGPYSTDDLRGFAASGKLPAMAKVRDVGRGTVVSVRDVIDGRAALAAAAAPVAALDAPGLAIRDDPPRESGPASSRAPRSGTARIKRGGTASRGGTGRVTRSSRRSSGGSGNGLKIGGVVGFILIAVIIGFIKFGVRSMNGVGADLRGTWVVDAEAMKREGIEGEVLAMMNHDVQLEFTSTTISMKEGRQPADSGIYRVTSHTGNHYEISIPTESGRTVRMSIDVLGDGRIKNVVDGTVFWLRRIR